MSLGQYFSQVPPWERYGWVAVEEIIAESQRRVDLGDE